MPLNFRKYHGSGLCQKNNVAFILSEIMAKLVAVHAV